MFASISKVHLLQERLCLEIANKLDIAEDNVFDRELALFILGGLGSEYDPIVAAITAQFEPLTIDDI